METVVSETVRNRW